MDPPPDASFPTRKELELYAQAWAKPRGYAISVQRSKPKKVWLQCNRAGQYRNRLNLDSSSRQRKTSSKASGCPFRLVGKLSGPTGDWELSTMVDEHNHDPSDRPSAHPQHRKLTTGQIQQVERMTNAGAPPRTIVMTLRDDPDGNPDFLHREVYNAKRDIKTAKLAGRTPIVISPIWPAAARYPGAGVWYEETGVWHDQDPNGIQGHQPNGLCTCRCTQERRHIPPHHIRTTK